MEYIVSGRHLSWQDNDEQGSGCSKAVKSETLDFFDELYAALSGGASTEISSVANVNTTVAGTDVAVGDKTVKNVPVKSGFLETDLNIPVLVGLSPTEEQSNTPAPPPAVHTVKKINWLMIVIIILVVIIFLRGLFLSDKS